MDKVQNDSDSEVLFRFEVLATVRTLHILFICINVQCMCDTDFFLSCRNMKYH
jgi:hypothetical protein